MLVKGKTPLLEPIVTIGLVMPEDKQTSITIKASSKNQQLSIKIDDHKLNLNGKIVNEIILKEEKDHFFKLNPVRAGRGFHWEKEIPIRVLGNLQIQNKNGCLFIKNNIKLEKYLACVATSEMSGDCPPALLEAQTIAARSWLLAAQEQKHIILGLDACNDDCCQRYQGIKNLTDAAISASHNTRGEILSYNNKICDTRYSKSCGGITENNENVWFDEPKPYLRGILDSQKGVLPNLSDHNEMKNWILENKDCFCNSKQLQNSSLEQYLGVVDKGGSYFRWEYTITADQLIKLVFNKLGISIDKILELIPVERGISGRITKMEIKGISNNKPHDFLIQSEYEIRRVLHPKFLYSSAFIIIANSDADTFLSQLTLKGSGWGHGVGLCQIGSLGMALEGKSYNQILSHYFLSTELKKIYD